MPVYRSKEKTADGRCWYFQVSQSVGGSNKKYKSRRFATKQEAEKAEAAFLLAGGHVAADRITFGQVADEYLAEKKQAMKPQSWLRARVLCGHVCGPLRAVPVAAMDVSLYETFRRSVAENASWSVSYKNKILNQVKALITFADRRHDVSNRLPWKYGPLVDSLSPRPVMQFFTLDEFQAFLAAVDDLRYRALFSVLFFCGLRVGEANALQWRDLDLAERTLSVNKTVSTKIRDADGRYLVTAPKTAGSVRVIPFPSGLSGILEELLAFWSRYDGFSPDWFVFGGLRPFPETSITKMKDRCCALAGVKKIRIHDFRHSCASFYIHLGASPLLLAQLLGHSSAKMTLDTYSHFYASDLRSLVEMAEICA